MAGSLCKDLPNLPTCSHAGLRVFCTLGSATCRAGHDELKPSQLITPPGVITEPGDVGFTIAAATRSAIATIVIVGL